MKKKATKRKIDTVEKLAVLVADGFEHIDRRFEHVDSRFEQVDSRFEQVDRRFDRIDTQLEHIEAELGDIHRRIESLEERGASQAGFAKEIDHLLARVSKIEKHLRLA